METRTFIITVIFFAALIFLTGCGDGSKDPTASATFPLSTFEGEYLNTADGTTRMVVDDVGNFQIFVCTYLGNFTEPDTSRNSILTITRTSPITGCLPGGEYQCFISLSAEVDQPVYLLIDCGTPSSRFIYEKI